MKLAPISILSIKLVLCGSLFATWEYPGEVDLIGTEEVVFDHSVDACEPASIPDTPIRAFRDADENIQILIGHNVTYRMIGLDFNSLSVDCANGPVFTSDHDADPANYNDNEWIGSVYTEDGATIYAMIHDEYHGHEHAGGCDTSDPFECWYNAVTFGVSTDSGRTYTHATPPDHLLASVPYTWTGAGPYGFFEPSNVIHNPNDGYYYMFITANEGHELQETGVGLVRTLDVSDPGSWRGWDGEAFTVQLINPYTETGFDPADHVLARIDANLRTYGNMEKMHYSLAYSTYFNKFILVDAAQKSGVWGFYYSISEDLLHWTPRVLIMEANVNINPDGSTSGLRESYPTLIDHGDTSRTFSQVGQTPYLYWTRYNQSAGDLYERDIMRVQISFSKILVDGFTVDRRGDSDDVNAGDGICATELGYCNLRAAIQEAYYRPEWYTDSLLQIDLGIEVSSHTFYAATPMFPILFPTVLDGTTQPEHVANSHTFGDSINAIYGGHLSGDYPDLVIEGDNSVIRGFEIDGSVTLLSDHNVLAGNSIGRVAMDSSSHNTLGGSADAERNRLGSVWISGPHADSNLVQGNYIGTLADGMTSAGSEFSAISVGNGADGNEIVQNLLSGSGFAGIDIGPGNADFTRVEGNIIGLDRTATVALPNPASGIKVGEVTGTIIRNNQIGGNDGEAGIFASNIQSSLIQSNLIGTNAAGDSLGNTAIGVWIFGDSHDNLIGGETEGEGNVIAFNGTHGIDLGVYWGDGTTISRNSIYGNGEYGILTPGEWNHQPPILSSALADPDSLILTGEFNGAPDSTFRLEFFSNTECDPSGSGEGETFLSYADVMTGAAGSVTFRHAIAGIFPTGTIVTATATDEDGNTSGFSECVTAFGSADAPILAVSTDTLTYTYYPEDTPISTQNIELANEGIADLEWTSSTSAGWIFLEPASGAVAGGDTITSGITVYALDTPDGVYHETVSILSNDPLTPEYEIRITIFNGEGGVPLIDVTPDTIRMTVPPGPDVSSSFVIHNVGAGQDNLNWTAGMTGLNWIFGINPSTGSTPAEDSSEVSFGIRPNNMNPGLNTGFLWVSSNAGNINVFEIQLEITLGEEGNQPPQAYGDSFTGPEDEWLTLSLTGSDPEGSPLNYQILDTPVHGWLDGTAPSLVFHPDSNFYGADSFHFQVDDGDLISGPATVFLEITPVNDPPATFLLLEPLDAALLAITAGNLDSETCFGWEEAEDVDSEVEYHFDTVGLEGIAVEPQTSIGICLTNSEIRAQMDSTHTLIYWNIYASDGEYDVYAENGPFTLNLVDSLTLAILQAALPEEFILEANYPNPFNPSTTIRFGVPHSTAGELTVYDLAGRQIRTLWQGILPLGYSQVTWDGLDASGASPGSGTYFAVLRIGDQTLVQKMLLMK